MPYPPRTTVLGVTCQAMPTHGPHLLPYGLPTLNGFPFSPAYSTAPTGEIPLTCEASTFGVVVLKPTSSALLFSCTPVSRSQRRPAFSMILLESRKSSCKYRP